MKIGNELKKSSLGSCKAQTTGCSKSSWSLGLLHCVSSPPGLLFRRRIQRVQRMMQVMIIDPATIEPTTMPAKSPLLKFDEGWEVGDAVEDDEWVDVAVVIVSEESECDDVGAAVVIEDWNTVGSTQPNWQPYSVKQYVSLYPQYPFWPQQTFPLSGRQRAPPCCRPHTPSTP